MPKLEESQPRTGPHPQVGLRATPVTRSELLDRIETKLYSPKKGVPRREDRDKSFPFISKGKGKTRVEREDTNSILVMLCVL
jgi:hypothetical protein